MARDYAPTNSLSLYCTASSILSLSASDYIEVQMLQASGSTQDAGYGQFGGFKVCSVQEFKINQNFNTYVLETNKEENYGITIKQGQTILR